MESWCEKIVHLSQGYQWKEEENAIHYESITHHSWGFSLLACVVDSHKVAAFSLKGWIWSGLLFHSRLKQNNPVGYNDQCKKLHCLCADSPAIQILLCLNGQCQHTLIADVQVDCECCICPSEKKKKKALQLVSMLNLIRANWPINFKLLWVNDDRQMEVLITRIYKLKWIGSSKNG